MRFSRRQLFAAGVGAAALAVAPAQANRLLTRAFRAPWDPTQATSAVLKAWWSASDYFLMTDDGSGLISSWPDRIQRLAVTATTTARGTWARNSMNSAYPGITLDGVANCYVTTTSSGLPTGSTAGEIWCVGSWGSNASTSVMCEYGGTGSATNRQVRKSTADKPQVSDGSVTIADSSLAVPGNHSLMGAWSGTTMNGYIDGQAFSGNPGTIATLNTGTTRLRIGAANASAAASFEGGVYTDILIWSGAISAAERLKAAAYFAWQYGFVGNLPSSNPYRGSPP